MDMTKKKCGECGEKSYAYKTIYGHWEHPWKDFPSVFVTKKLELWICTSCQNYAILAGDAEKIDAAIQSSVQDQVSQFLDIIKSKSGLSFEEIALRIGYTPSYLASLKQKNKIPSFKIWNQLKSIAVDPTMELEKLSPNFDIIRKNILLRA